MSTPKTKAGLRFAAALSTCSDTTEAIAEVCSEAASALEARPDLAIVFVSHHHGPSFEAVAAGIRQRTHTVNLIGCTGEAIVGGSREVEGRPALALWLAHLPDVTIRTRGSKVKKRVTIRGRVSDPSGISRRITVRFGDRTSRTVIVTKGRYSVSHVYRSARRFTITVTAKDRLRRTSRTTRKLVIRR